VRARSKSCLSAGAKKQPIRSRQFNRQRPNWIEGGGIVKKWLLFAVPILCAAAFSSCRTPSAGITVESYPKTKIAVNSKIVGRWLEVTDTTAAKRDNDLLQAQVTVQNRRQYDCQFEYRFRWLNKNGMAVGSGLSVWTPISISAREKALLNGVAPSKEVEDFILDVRFSNPGSRWSD
jgi:uncharacterized protein YcfL